MTQEKAKKHQLFAVPNAAENASDESKLYTVQPLADEPEICPLCYGSGMEVVPGKGARQCECRKQKTRPDRMGKARIPKRYLECDFNTFIPNNESQRTAVWLAQKLSSEFHPGYDEQGILFVGNCGVGKTHLAVSILKAIAKKGYSCLFYEFGALLKEIQSSYNSSTQTSELGVLSPIFDAEILVLDEIGASKATEWVRDTMAHIINTRYNDKKLTIFTTNYFDKTRNERDETLEDRIGVRLRSRLFEMCKTIVIGGEDYRRKYDHTNK
ncbi:ATP-binding protein [soil metagenome]